MPRPSEPPGRADDGIARRRGRQINILSHAVQPARILKRRQLDAADLLRLRLSRLGYAYRSVGADADGQRIRRNRNRRIERIAVRRHHVSLVVEMEHARAGVAGLAAGHLHLKKPGSLDRQVQRIAGGVEVALHLDDLRRRRLRPQTNLQTGGDCGVLRRRRARHDQVLVDQVLEL